VAVGVGLDDGEDPDARPDLLSHDLEVPAERGEVDLGPDAGGVHGIIEYRSRRR
jgi:hypothetical protein